MIVFNEEEYREAEDMNLGFCKLCEDWTRECTEPDAANYDCPACDENSVIGSMNYLIEYA